MGVNASIHRYESGIDLISDVIAGGKPPGTICVLFEGRGPRYYRFDQRADGWLKIVDVTDETTEAIELDVTRIRSTIALEDHKRRRLIALEDQDHFERTRVAGRLQPTAATKNRLKQDPLTRMLKSGSLTTEQGWAADEIHQIYCALQGSLFQRAAAAEARGRRGDGIAAGIAARHHSHYRPWAEYLGGAPYLPPVGDHPGRPAKVAHCPKAIEIVIDVIIDGLTLTEVEKRHGWERAGTASDVFRYALCVYTQIAGWERNGNAIRDFEAKLGKRRVPL